MASKRDFVLRRLHSLLGVVPVGIFLVQHLIINHFATQGEEAYNQAANFMGSLPFVLLLETVLIYIPLLFHGILGVYIAFIAKNNPISHSYFRNWMFTLQRISGIILIAFIGWHVWETRIQKALGVEVNFQMMENILTQPISFIFYILGILSAAFHLANGLWSFLVRWGITQTEKSQRISTWVMALVFLFVSTIGIRAAIAFVYPELFVG